MGRPRSAMYFSAGAWAGASDSLISCDLYSHRMSSSRDMTLHLIRVHQIVAVFFQATRCDSIKKMCCDGMPSVGHHMSDNVWCCDIDVY